jgi:glucosylceramidase
MAAQSPAASSAKSKAPAGEVDVRVTNQRLRFAQGPSLQWQRASGAPADDAVLLSPELKFQPILGFGVAFTDAACYMLNQLPASGREALFHKLFHSSEMGLSVCRTCIGSSDYSTKVYSYDEGEPDPNLSRFSIDHDREYILPILREARKVNPDLFLFSSPWSPPGWMKPNGSMLGGCMQLKYMPSYAQYFLKFLQGYAAAGVPVQAVTIQNEVDTNQDGRMPACQWGQEYEVAFVTKHLGPLFASNRINTKIWVIDHNYNLWGRAICELQSPGMRDYTNAIAWHGYVGQPEWMQKVSEAYPDVEMYWTEGGPDYTAPDYATDWSNWSKTFTTVLRNGCRSITGWNLALDERGRPNIGPFNCGGTVTINSKTKEISHSGQFWALAHYSSLVRRGAERFDSQSVAPNLHHVAFENPAGDRVLVLTNTGPGRTCEIRMGNWVVSASLEQDSVSTLAWS